MSMAAVWIALAAVLALLAGLLQMLVGRSMRLRRGLSGGKTVSLDWVTLTSHRLGLTGRPDRLIKADGAIIIEEWKSAVAPRADGRLFSAGRGTARIRPSHGFVVLGDGTRHRVDNTSDLRAWVLDLAGQIRTARAEITRPIPVEPKPGQCRPCGMRGHCGQAHLDFA